MSCIVPFKECVARSSDGQSEFLLTDHLLAVREYIENRLINYEPILTKLMGLAGICHDLAKANPDWQRYVKGKKKTRPNHSPAGAFVFSFLGHKMLQNKKMWSDYCIYWLWLIRDIADHHGQLKNLNNSSWINAGGWLEVDLQGILAFISEMYPEFNDTNLSVKVLEDWAIDVYDLFEDAMDTIYLGYNHVPHSQLMKQIVLWRELTSTLISGDRFHVGYGKYYPPAKKDSVFDEEAIIRFCSDKSDQNFSDVRERAQLQILDQLKQDPEKRVYTIEMPTGYGKTITSLRIASWLGAKQGYQKLIYVAPYISILEQTSKVIEEVLNTNVLEHHSLAVFKTNEAQKEKDENIKSGQLIMESWDNKVVCTSFQQFSKALFPVRAQDTLRRAYLKDSIIIIDEPQIFDPQYWNVFLCALEEMSLFYNLCIIFLSATMPPFDYGLSEEPGFLNLKVKKPVERYRIVRYGQMDENEFADFIADREEKVQGAILNTIEDAYLVYNRMKDYHSNLKLLHGMMIPLHKRMEIAKIKDHVKKIKEDSEKVCVISTQVIEAGVDLSFEHIGRALPILPSIIQAAGRVNRHFERPQGGILSVIPFFRGGEKNTRNSIYNSNLLKITDDLLSQQEIWLETQMLDLIKKYYQKMFEKNTYETSKQAIIDAYQGNWLELSKLQPFGVDYYKLPIFVPWDIEAMDEKWLPEKYIALQEKLKMYSSQEIYSCYEQQNYNREMSFEERKEFMILFNHFIINVPAKLAFSITDKELYLQNKIPKLLETDAYDAANGLAKRYVEGFDNII